VGNSIFKLQFYKEQERRVISGRTARCLCIYRYVSKFTAALRGFHCDSTAFVLKNKKNYGVKYVYLLPSNALF